jgi:hypothetical protein
LVPAAITATLGGILPNPTVTLAGGRPGYYTTVITAKDQAGNVSTMINPATGTAMNTAAFQQLSYTVYYDGGAGLVPTVLTPTQGTVAINNGATAPAGITFNSAVSDNGDLFQSYWTVNYGAVASFEQNRVTLNTYNTAPFVNTNIATSLPMSFFAGALQSLGVDSITFAAAQALTTVVASATDQLPNTTNSTAYAPVNVTGAIAAWTALGAGDKLFVTTSIDPATALGTPTISLTGATGGTALGGTLILTSTGTVGQPVPIAFTRLEYWVNCGVGGNWTMVGATNTAPALTSTIDNGLVRTWTWSTASFTPGAAFGPNCLAGPLLPYSRNVIAVLYKADGGVTMTPAKIVNFVL